MSGWPGSPPDVQNVYALLKLLEDPKGYSKKLKEYEAIAKDASDKTEALVAAYAQQKSLEDYKLEVEKIKADLKSQQEALDTARAEITLTAEQITKDRSNIDISIQKHGEEYTKRKNALDTRENDISNREQVLEANLKQAQYDARQASILKQELEDKLTRLRIAVAA